MMFWDSSAIIPLCLTESSSAAMRELFEKDLISIPSNPKLISQLSQMRYEFTTLSKIKIKDPEGKSPDYADSLMLTMMTNQNPGVTEFNW